LAVRHHLRALYRRSIIDDQSSTINHRASLGHTLSDSDRRSTTTVLPEGKHRVFAGCSPTSYFSTSSTATLIDHALAKKSAEPTTVTPTLNINSPTSTTTGTTLIDKYFDHDVYKVVDYFNN
jgi:hypothetical protein